MDPQDVWQNFYQLTQIPRPSHHEEQVRDFLVQFGKGLGLETIVDDVGNVLIRKPASPGMENRHGVILQAHMDMVAQPLDGTHDFLTEPIDAYVEGDWVMADGTTLGADDGSGVAIAMAVLQSKTLALGPIEALFTVNEEDGMDGALGLQPGLLQGDTLINLDSENEGEFTIGSAGGDYADVERQLYRSSRRRPHSGVHGDRQRAAGRPLRCEHQQGPGARHQVAGASVEPGRCSNTACGWRRSRAGPRPMPSPRQATALVVVPNDQVDAFLKYVQQYEGIVQSELAAVEPDLKVEATPAALPAKVMDEKVQRMLIDALYGTPQGVIRMSDAVPGLVETSTNMGIVNTADGQVGSHLSLAQLGGHGAGGHQSDDRQRMGPGGYSGDDQRPLFRLEPQPQLADPAPDAGCLQGRCTDKTPRSQPSTPGWNAGRSSASIRAWTPSPSGRRSRTCTRPNERMLVASVKKLNDFLIETLKQIPEKTAQPAPTPEPTAEAAATIQPLSMEECDGEAQAMAHALDVMAATQSDAPISDPVTGATGTGCMATVTGTGEQFESPDAVVKTLGAMLAEQGWTADPMLAAGGPNAIDEGYRKGDQICWAGAGWQADDSANCPKDQPVSACTVTPAQQIYTITLNCGVETSQAGAAATTGMANPASENCVKQGGTVSIVERGDGGQYGICTFADNQQCEEWALLRGDCPVGGVRITGYVTPAATYCAITGGTYAATGNGRAGRAGCLHLQQRRGVRCVGVLQRTMGAVAEGESQIEIVQDSALVRSCEVAPAASARPSRFVETSKVSAPGYEEQTMRSLTSSCTRREFLLRAGGGIAALVLLPAQPRSAVSAGKPPAADLDVKIGQMILAGFRDDKLKDKNPIVADIHERYLGGVVLFDYDVAMQKYKRNIKSPKQLQELDADLLAASPVPPLLISVDQEGGRINRLKPAYGFPPSYSEQYLGTLNDLGFTHECAETTAQTLKSVGINLNLAPVVDLNVNPDNPIIGYYERSFSADPDIVTAHALEVIKAHHEYGVLTTLKHFPGHGSSTGDSHLGFVDVTDTWAPVELEPFRNIIQAGMCDVVMTAHIFNAHLDPDYPATLS